MADVPEKCEKCKSDKIVIKYCDNSNKRKSSVIVGMWVGNSGGFVCTNIKDHFHYYCKTCGFWR